MLLEFDEYTFDPVAGILLRQGERFLSSRARRVCSPVWWSGVENWSPVGSSSSGSGTRVPTSISPKG